MLHPVEKSKQLMLHITTKQRQNVHLSSGNSVSLVSFCIINQIKLRNCVDASHGISKRLAIILFLLFKFISLFP